MEGGLLAPNLVSAVSPLMRLQPSSRQRELIALAGRLARERFAPRADRHDRNASFPAEDDGRLHLAEQFRYPVKGRYWELPQGSWEQAPEADPLEVAHGELREETGLDAAPDDLCRSSL